MPVYHVFTGPSEARRGHQIPWHELPSGGCWKSNLGLLEGHSVLITMELALLPLGFNLLKLGLSVLFMQVLNAQTPLSLFSWFPK